MGHPAIMSMSFEDARKLLAGGDTSILEFFKEKTTGRFEDGVSSGGGAREGMRGRAVRMEVWLQRAGSRRV